MKLRINGFENEIIFNDDKINVLEIEDTKCFTHIVETINQKIGGIENNEIFLLNDEDEEQKMDKDMYMLNDVFNIDFSSRKILGKIYEIIALNIEKSQDFAIEEMTVKLRNKIIEEVNELPFEFEMDRELDIPSILKMYNLKLDRDNYTTVLERIELVIDILATLKLAKVLVIPNLKTFLDEEELLELYKYSLYNDIRVLIIERNIYKKNDYERVLKIDENFCETII